MLNIQNATQVANRLDEGDVSQIDTPTTSGIQSMTFVNESGMYDVIIRSDSENAKPFRKWVTSEVLPGIPKRNVRCYEYSQLMESDRKIEVSWKSLKKRLGIETLIF